MDNWLRQIFHGNFQVSLKALRIRFLVMRRCLNRQLPLEKLLKQSVQRNIDRRDMKKRNSSVIQASNNTSYFPQKKTKFAKKLKSCFRPEAWCIELNDANPSCVARVRVMNVVVISRRLLIKLYYCGALSVFFHNSFIVDKWNHKSIWFN